MYDPVKINHTYVTSVDMPRKPMIFANFNQYSNIQ